jgi:hypothetical protein
LSWLGSCRQSALSQRLSVKPVGTIDQAVTVQRSVQASSAAPRRSLVILCRRSANGMSWSQLFRYRSYPGYSSVAGRRSVFGGRQCGRAWPLFSLAQFVGETAPLRLDRISCPPVY